MRENNKKKYGITLKAAKAKVKAEIGRYPRPGHEYLITKGTKNGRKYELWLVNSAGSFYLHQYNFQ
ncbi:MAG: hypothetical protein CVU39_06290 [Chloroflexi bacterium HGW-Chloroflexi-10]|nr:MAG: hypothetical protein CVU39_06290 [Chloroflexi bacterium HGW-Chloroflexi-10]